MLITFVLYGNSVLPQLQTYFYAPLTRLANYKTRQQKLFFFIIKNINDQLNFATTPL